MSTVNSNGIRLEYEEFGSADDPAILLIMGFSLQMIAWPDYFCHLLADAGFRVIRFDNRDVGLSTHLDGVAAPGMVRSFLAYKLGLPLATPYTLDDMALDSVGLLDKLGIGKAHIVGASMGGMIAQVLAAKHGHRVCSLTSMMSTSGKRTLPGPRLRLVTFALRNRRASIKPEAMHAYLVDFFKLIGSPGYPTPREQRSLIIGQWVARDCDIDGQVRQFAAMAATGDRSALLRTIDAPTLVIHGEDDPLIPVQGGRHTAECISGSSLQVIPGMGHDLPEQLLPVLAERIAGHCRQAQNRTEARTSVDT